MNGEGVIVLVEVHLDPYLGPFGLNDLTPIRFFVSEPVKTTQHTRLLAKCRKRRQRREQVRGIREVDVKGLGTTSQNLDAFIGSCQLASSEEQGAFDRFVRLGIGAV